jgi:hypothetical protein
VTLPVQDLEDRWATAEEWLMDEAPEADMLPAEGSGVDMAGRMISIRLCMTGNRLMNWALLNSRLIQLKIHWIQSATELLSWKIWIRYRGGTINEDRSIRQGNGY